MQALKLDAMSGWRWVVAGWQIFRKQPFGFVSLLFFYFVLLYGVGTLIGSFAAGLGKILPSVLTDIVALAGGLLVAVIMPALSVGFQQACRVATSGLNIHPILLFAPFRGDRQTVRRLFTLGLIQAVAMLFLVLVVMGPSAFRADPVVEKKPVVTAPVAPASTPTGELTAEQEEAIRQMSAASFKQALTIVPIALITWYAPMLIAWHGLPPGKAIFFSIVAVWRNRGAFAIYAAGWLSIWMGLSITFGIAFGLLNVIGIGGLAAVLAVPLTLSMVTCMYCSVYASYATVFVDPQTPAAERAPPG